MTNILQWPPLGSEEAANHLRGTELSTVSTVSTVSSHSPGWTLASVAMAMATAAAAAAARHTEVGRHMIACRVCQPTVGAISLNSRTRQTAADPRTDGRRSAASPGSLCLLSRLPVPALLARRACSPGSLCLLSRLAVPALPAPRASSPGSLCLLSRLPVPLLPAPRASSPGSLCLLSRLAVPWDRCAKQPTPGPGPARWSDADLTRSVQQATSHTFDTWSVCVSRRRVSRRWDLC